MNAVGILPLDVVGWLVEFWIALGVAGLILQRTPQLINNVIFPLSALISLLLAATGLWALAAVPNIMVLPLGLPDLPFHLRLDPLSAFFLILLGGASLGVSLFSAGYFKSMAGDTLGLVCLEYHLFLVGMTLVLLADDAYMFMVAWETMALVFLFPGHHRSQHSRHPQGGLSLSADRACRCDRDPAQLRRDAGRTWHRSLHFRCDACCASDLVLVIRRVPAGLVRLRCEGRCAAAACLVARGASGRAFAGVRADERCDAEDGDLRHPARHLRSAGYADCGGGACWRWRWD